MDSSERSTPTSSCPNSATISTPSQGSSDATSTIKCCSAWVTASPVGAAAASDASVGTSLDLPTEPYAKVTYRIALPLLERNLLRLRESIFWEESERFGATTRVDLERLVANDFLVRWTGSATFTQETEGVRWFSQLTLFQNLHEGRAISYQLRDSCRVG